MSDEFVYLMISRRGCVPLNGRDELDALAEAAAFATQHGLSVFVTVEGHPEYTVFIPPTVNTDIVCRLLFRQAEFIPSACLN